MFRTAVLCVALMLAVTAAVAQIPRTMTYQGILKDSSGEPVGNGNYNVTFRMYDAPSGGNLLWTEIVMVSTDGGYFKAELGNVLPLNLPFSQAYFLSIQLQGDSEMTDRQKLNLSAYAARSDTSAIAISSMTADNAEALDGYDSGDFALAVHNHDPDYVNENQSNSVNSLMIADDQIVDGDISPAANISASKINNGEGSGLDADLLDGANSTYFAPAVHNHDPDYVNENQSNSISSSMITDNQVVNSDISSSANIAASKISDGAGSGLDADMLDGLNSTDFLNSGSDYGRSGVASDLYEGTNTLTVKYINSAGPDTITASNLMGTTFVADHTNDGTGILGKASSSDLYGAAGVSGNATAGGFLSSVAIGISGFATNSTVVGGLAYGGYFSTASTGNATHYGAYGYSNHYGLYGSGGLYGVYYSGGLAGTGTKSCIVKTSQGPTLLYCQESPENWFEDFGDGRLANGQAHIDLDPLFRETVTIDDANPMKVFVQLEGDCNGVYVSKGSGGFDVIELNKGTSDVPFSYRVVAKRAGFENRRLDYTESGLQDPYLYPENSDERPNSQLLRMQGANEAGSSQQER